jgi:signal transduction histidine kinase
MQGYDGSMTTESWTDRIDETDPLVIDAIIAFGLTVLVFVQIAALGALQPEAPGPAFIRAIRGPHNPGVAAYLIAAGAFVPLIVRRKIPWLALLLTSAFALLYTIGKNPPAFVMLGPMIAMYSTAAYSRRRFDGFAWLLVGGLVLAAVAFAFTGAYRGAMEVIGAFVMLVAAAFLGDTARSRRQYIAEVEQRALEAERTREEEALRRVDEERIRIAREVHDIVAHSLSIVTVQANAADKLLDDDPEKARESIHNIRSTSKQALGELRSMLDILRTGEADSELAPAPSLEMIERLVQPVREAGLDVELDVTVADDAVPAYAAVSAYRIVQEALTNTVRHAHAASVSVSVARVGTDLVVDVVDDGSASDEQPHDSDTTEGDAAGAGHGIQGMRERVNALGGTLEAGPNATGGFSVRATIPLSGRTS